MFGVTPVCPRCSKAVYAAEQVIGPGRKLYHKPCLACSQCNKRLDSYTLLEHDEQPYCKACHLKSFGTPNLRHANLPTPGSPGGSPTGKRSTSPTATTIKPINTGATAGSTNGNGTSFPILRPNRSLTSPTSPTFAKTLSYPISPTYGVNAHHFGSGDHNTNGIDESIMEGMEYKALSTQDDPEVIQTDVKEPDANVNEQSVNTAAHANITNTGRPGIGTIPRTVPLRRHMGSRSIDTLSTNAPNIISTHSTGIGSSMSSSPPPSFAFAQSRSPTSPRFTSLTGTRYGIALTGGIPTHNTGGIMANNKEGVFPSPTGGSPRKWGSGTPSCPRCGKSVYFAEQVKAAGKTFHKTCLRCVDCGTSLDSHKLRDHEGAPYCVRCYQKAYGPQGNGYALLGKAGG